jgi:hypothetical protein
MPASFHYLSPLKLYSHQKPYLSRLPFLKGLKRTNIVGQSYPMTIFDVSGHEDSFTLEKSGFQFLPLQFHASTWTDQSVQSEYIPMLSKWLKGHFACDEVFVYAFNVHLSYDSFN